MSPASGRPPEVALQNHRHPAKLNRPYERQICHFHHRCQRAMPDARTAVQVFDQELLQLRAKLLEIAAALDRIDRAEGSIATDARRTQVQGAIQVLLRPSDDRAEQIQLIFSRPYEDDWREKLGVL